MFFFSHCPGAAPRRGRWRSITRAHRGVFALPTDHTDYGPPPRPPTCTLVAHNGARASSRRPLSRAEVAHGDRGVMAFCRCYRHCTGTTRTLRSLCASAGLLAWCCMCFLALISPVVGAETERVTKKTNRRAGSARRQHPVLLGVGRHRVDNARAAHGRQTQTPAVGMANIGTPPDPSEDILAPYEGR